MFFLNTVVRHRPNNAEQDCVITDILFCRYLLRDRPEGAWLTFGLVEKTWMGLSLKNENIKILLYC